jgi:hypothetical protein
MKSHLEIIIRINPVPFGGLHQILSEFANETDGWLFPREKSEDYQRGAGYAAGFAVWPGGAALRPAAVAVANVDKKRTNTFIVPNIVPQASSSLTLDEYNAIGIAFATDFRHWLKRRSLRGVIETVGPNRTLRDIIPGLKTRQFFESWLRTPTPLSHPSDLYVLDRFICHLFRHRGKTRTWEIESYLINDLHWKSEDARWVAARIETGLELLRVDRSF